MKYILFFLMLLSSLFTKENVLLDHNSSRNDSKEKILNYAQNISESIPIPSDYSNVNILGVTKKNINKINQTVIKLESGKRDKAYIISPNQDYMYNFKDTNVQIIPLILKNLTINLNEHSIDNDTTVFLKIYVDTTKLGKYFTPKISVMYKGKTLNHTLEPYSKGIRYINLSQLNLTRGTTLKIDTTLVSLHDQAVELLIYKNPVFINKKILIIAPHPDDAEIAAFGLYSQYSKNIHIVTITAGDAGNNNVYKDIYTNTKKQYLSKGKIRTLDSITVPLLGGVLPQKCINLGYFDHTLRTMHNNKLKQIKGEYTKLLDINTFRRYNVSSLLKEINASSTWPSLIHDMTTLLNKIKPDIIVTPHPKLDRHSDHIFSTEALLEALQQSSIRQGKLFLYTNHAIGSEYYPYGNMGDPITLPPVYKNTNLYFDSIYAHPLSKDVQDNKIFALEAMSDLRFLSSKNKFKERCTDEPNIICKDYSYLRRAVRSNELFFIVDIKKLIEHK